MATSRHNRPGGAEEGVAFALAELRQRRPRLIPLVRSITRRGDGTYAMGPRFLAKLKASRSTSKADVVRALFGDPSLFRVELVPKFTPALAERVVTFLAALPSQPMDTGHAYRDEIPKPLYRLFGGSRMGKARSLFDAIAVTLWDYQLGRRPRLPAGALPGLEQPQVLRVLAPLLECRHLTEERAKALAAEDFTAAKYSWYFDTPIPALSMRNAALFAAVLLDGPRYGGRIQNKIPLHLSRRFKLKPRSVPELLPLFDVMSMAFDGVLDIPGKDCLRLRELFAEPVPGGRNQFWEPVIALHRNRGFVDADYALEAEEGGTFETSLRFNAARVTGLVETQSARLKRFAVYYDAVRRTRLQARCEKLWGKIAPALRRECRALARSRRLTVPAIRIRDLGNILARDALYPTEENALPPVALFALGQAEPARSRKKKKVVKRTRRRSEAAPRGRLKKRRWDDGGALLVSKLRNKLSGSSR